MLPAAAFLTAGRTLYVGLFAWLSSRSVFVSTKIVTPIGLVVVLLSIVTQGGQNHATALAPYVAGISSLLAVFGGVFGVTSVLRHARNEGLLHYANVAPRHRLWVVASILPFTVADGVLTACVVLPCFGWVAGTNGGSDWPAVVVALLVVALAASVLGLLVAQVEQLIPRNTGELTTVVYTMTTILSGAVVPLERMPAWMASIARFWPMQNSVRAVRTSYVDGVFDGPALGRELAVLAVAAVVVVVATELLRRSAHRSGRAIDPWL